MKNCWRKRMEIVVLFINSVQSVLENTNPAYLFEVSSMKKKFRVDLDYR